ncbi:hypothetical protein KFE17_05825 [Faecalicatena sp. Marseille-Q4148]|nr:hypothetical protein KFE17_05825 [Faecalicatena sp. Marseille-Q4148]
MSNKKCRIYAACGVSQTPIYKKERGAFHFEEMMVHRMENWNEIRRKEVC